jgi:Spy/CpxP family protein refolding chaperone
MMKKFLTIFTFFLCVSVFNVQSQTQQQPPAPSKMANLQGLKIAYITRQLSLTSDEAQKFWPVYYEFMDELKAARQKNKGNEIASDEAALVVKKKYLIEFKKVLGTDERANKVFSIEREFAAEVKKELEKRQQKRQQFRK